MTAPRSEARRLVVHLRAGLAAWFPDIPATCDSAASPSIGDALDLAPLIDHTLLVPTDTDDDIRRLCDEAAQHGFHAVCVHGARLPVAVAACGPSVAVACVVDFPLGAASTVVRAHQAATAVEVGARELDLVAPAGVLVAAIPSDDPSSWCRASLEAWVTDVAAVTASAREAGPCQVKLILETDRLSPAQIVAGALLAEQAGVDFVKTSTGFGKGGATAEAVALLHAAVGGRLGVKASGGIRTRADALAMVRAGATRLGTSGSMALLDPAGEV